MSLLMERTPTRMAIVLPWATLLKVVLALALVLAATRLASVLAVITIAALLAVTLAPLVGWLERHRVPRPLAAIGLTLALVAVVGGLLWAAIPVATEQAAVVGAQLRDAATHLAARLPRPVADAARQATSGQAGLSAVAGSVTAVGGGLLRGLGLVVLTLALTLYLLIDGQRTYAWLLAYVPRDRRQRAGETAEEAQRIVAAYVGGNVFTSLLATIFTFAVLSLLGVPAALVLALLAGVFDFLPVVGFILSLGPALLLAFTVSPTTALGVAGFYVAYHLFEAYYVTPKVYGNRLRLSDVAVLLAFTLGFELGGVVGALLSLPIAAAYPAVERIWLAERLGTDVIREHEEIAEKSPGDPL